MNGSENVPDSFRVHEKEKLVFDHRSAERRRPLIIILEGTSSSPSLEQWIIGIQVAPGPVVGGVSMPGVRSGLRRVVDLGPCLAAILTGVAVVHKRHFLQFIATQQKVARPRVIQVKKWVVVVVTIHREQI